MPTAFPNAAVKFNVEMFDDPQALANEFFHDLPHPSIGPTRVLAPPIKLDGDGFQPAHPTATFASKTRKILHSLGFTASDVDAPTKSGATRDTSLG